MAIRRANSSKLLGDTYRNAMADQAFGTGGSGASTPPDPWVRPADWLNLPAASTSFTGLAAVWDASSNYVAFSVAGDYTVDWGDGSALENFTSGVIAQHNYNYSAAPLVGTESSRGYRQAIVTVSPQSGQSFTTIDLNWMHTAVPVGVYLTSPWLEIDIDGADLTTIWISATGSTYRAKHSLLECVRIGNHSNLTSPMTSLFSSCGSLRSATVDMTSVTTADYMFDDCNALTGLDVVLTNTSSLLNVEGMFYSCYNLYRAPLLSMSAVTNSSYMFRYCQGLCEATINLPSSADMSYMFADCTGLRSAAIGAGAVTTMNYMFYNCSALTLVQIQGTLNSLASVYYMFYRCNALEQAPYFDTSSLTDASYMFQDCHGLREVPQYDLSSALTVSGMFYYCYTLDTVPDLNTVSCTDFNYMFYDCLALRKAPLLDTSSGQTFYNTFAYCYALDVVPLFNLSSATDTSYMFSGCSSLRTVPLFNTSQVQNMSNMFSYCYALVSVPLFSTSLVTTMYRMFSSCYSLKEVPLFNTASVGTMDYMFQYCSSLTAIPQFNTSSVTTMAGMFRFCFSLQTVPALDASAVTSSAGFSNMFGSCTSLRRIGMTGIKWTFSANTCALGSIELNELYTNLATVIGQTITVTGNPGVGSDDPTIATAKGWTVTGS